ncbi:MAG: hypothetical protein D8M59_15635 [Planctomycetes bacterium]|nr:hypothetical protein [Planctomycetota bacterium]
MRPIQPGIRIINAIPRTLGTIGLIGYDLADGSRWIVSCRHVLARSANWNGTPAATGEPIYQPKDDDPANVVATTDLSRTLDVIDAAAARIVDGIDAISDVLYLDQPIGVPTNAAIDMPVVKSGSRTGVTYGVVTAVGPDTIEVGPRPGETKALTKSGDSGAIWLEEGTLAPVAMHSEGNVGGVERSLAIPIAPVLAALGLTVVCPAGVGEG